MLERRGLAGYVELFRGAHLAFGDVRDTVARWWDLDALHARYAEFLDRHEPVRAAGRAGGGSAPAQAFADYVGCSPTGGGCPTPTRVCRWTCCPPDWNGARAADLFAELRGRLAGPAHEHARRLIARLTVTSAQVGQGGDALHLDQRLGVPQPGDADPGHRRVVGADQPAPDARRSRGRGRGSPPGRRCRPSAWPGARARRPPRAGRSAGCPAPARTAPRRRRPTIRPSASSAVCPARNTIRPVPASTACEKPAGRASSGGLIRSRPFMTAPLLRRR